jgi:membrane protease subunit HflK
MSWNESGGNKNPWDRKPDQGPPDLDEIFRNLQRKLSGLFGGKGTPSAGGAGGGAASLNWGIIVAALVGLWGLTGFYIVDAAERAVITRFGKFSQVADSGLNWHLPWPIESKQIVNVAEVLSFTDRTRMLTQDEALVDINLAVQYRRVDPVLFTFNVREPERTLGEVSESAIREVIGQSKLDFVLEKGRQEISVRTKQLVQKTLDGYRSGIEVSSINLQDVSVPEQVAPSQKDAIKAREDKDRLQLEAQTYSNDILPKARGNAERNLQDAQAYRSRIVADAEGEGSRFAQLVTEYERAPNVTRQRLYLETMESVLGNSNKVIVDAKGNGNMLYLPLDKLLDRIPAGARVPSGEVTVTPIAPRNTDGLPENDGRARESR